MSRSMIFLRRTRRQTANSYAAADMIQDRTETWRALVLILKDRPTWSAIKVAAGLVATMPRAMRVTSTDAMIEEGPVVCPYH